MIQRQLIHSTSSMFPMPGRAPPRSMCRKNELSWVSILPTEKLGPGSITALETSPIYGLTTSPTPINHCTTPTLAKSSWMTYSRTNRWTQSYWISRQVRRKGERVPPQGVRQAWHPRPVSVVTITVAVVLTEHSTVFLSRQIRPSWRDHGNGERLPMGLPMAVPLPSEHPRRYDSPRNVRRR